MEENDRDSDMEQAVRGPRTSQDICYRYNLVTLEPLTMQSIKSWRLKKGPWK